MFFIPCAIDPNILLVTAVIVLKLILLAVKGGFLIPVARHIAEYYWALCWTNERPIENTQRSFESHVVAEHMGFIDVKLVPADSSPLLINLHFHSPPEPFPNKTDHTF